MFTTKPDRGANENCVPDAGDWTPIANPSKCFVLSYNHFNSLTVGCFLTTIRFQLFGSFFEFLWKPGELEYFTSQNTKKLFS